MIKVSVVIPIYNVEPYIAECIVSVVKQTLEDIEIICVNDGTKDSSMDIVKKYAEKDDRFIIIDKENGGLSSARNAGLQQATGEYVYFLDSDDWIQPDMLDELYKEAHDGNLDNIYFDADVFYENDEVERKNRHYMSYYHRPEVFDEIVSGQQLFANMENQRYYRPSACLQMPRRSLLLNNKIQFYEGILHEDQLFSLQVILSAKRVKHVAHPYYMRRVREDSIMTGTRLFQSSYGYYVCLTQFQRFLATTEIKDMAVEEAIEKRLHGLQTLATRDILSMEESDWKKELQEYPLETRNAYYLLVGRVYEEQKRANKQLQSEKQKADKKMKSIRSSVSYKIGKGITYLPFKVKSFVSSVRYRGLYCACNDIKQRLLPQEETNKILVSIIIPMYNAQKYLRECLDSLRMQTLSSIEIICVNDGSTDDTGAILEQYASKDARIHNIYQDNQGAGAARNHGMKYATGEYFLFLDADDIFDKRLCEETYKRAVRDCADIVLFEAYRYNVQTRKKEEMNWVLREGLLPSRIPFSVKQANSQLYQITTACPWSKLFRAEFVKKEQIQFQNVKNANDVFFVRMALACAKRITVLRKRLITYRYNDGSNLQSRKKKAPIEFYKAFKALKEELIRRGLYVKMEQSYVNMALKESLFNLESTQDKEAQRVIEDLLLKEGFDFFGFQQYDKSYFYNEKEYEEYKRLINGR